MEIFLQSVSLAADSPQGAMIHASQHQPCQLTPKADMNDSTFWRPWATKIFNDGLTAPLIAALTSAPCSCRNDHTVCCQQADKSEPINCSKSALKKYVPSALSNVQASWFCGAQDDLITDDPGCRPSTVQANPQAHVQRQ